LLVEQYLWIAWQEAKKARRRGGLSYAELVSAGYVGLVKAGRNFDVSKVRGGNVERGFVAFARRAIHNSIADELKRESRHMEKEIPFTSLGDPVKSVGEYRRGKPSRLEDGDYYRPEECKWDNPQAF
jgi:RNA polymerase sigma factor (sigma-70 family)